MLPNLNNQKRALAELVSISAMTETDAERYRRQAEQCRKLAERSANEFDEKSWLHLAEDWIKLAEADEESRAKD
jgi:hypothetical protein